MGRGIWNRIAALLIALGMMSCGGTGGGPSDSGNQFLFSARGRLNLVAQVTNDPRKLLITATLLDPQGLPFRNTPVTFTADFADATFVPGEDNRGSVTTDDNGQATITLIAGLTIGKMRVLAEAPAALNIATGITVTLTTQGFVSLGDLGIIPTEVTFINPLVGPGSTNNPMTIFSATGGTPPYRWDNSNKDLAKIEPTGIANVNETAKYTLIGPIPTDTKEALQDTVRLLDAAGKQATATVSVIFAECHLRADGTNVTLAGIPGRDFEVDVGDGVPPFSVTTTFPGSVDIEIVVVDARGNIIPGEVCDTAGEHCVVILSLPEDPNKIRFVNPDTILIRDARGCTASVALTVQPAATVVVTADPAAVSGSTGGSVTITAGVFDPSNQPIEGATVLFTTTLGTLDPTTAQTDASGQATTVLIIPANAPTGSVTVTASALGSSGETTVTITSP
ncbi:MAG TPA: hypothetical protein VNN62_00960 [Methylomirabilota bacterium]|nr:hypothetical protein [Methylomirabilota bacterium]